MRNEEFAAKIGAALVACEEQRDACRARLIALRVQGYSSEEDIFEIEDALRQLAGVHDRLGVLLDVDWDSFV